MSVVNGSVTQYKSLVFLLQPTQQGRLEIKGVTARVDGKRIKSNAVSIEVTNKNVPPSATPPAPAFNFSLPGDRAEAEREFYLRPGENVIDKIKKNLFVKV